MHLISRDKPSGVRRYFELAGDPASLICYGDGRDDEKDMLGSRVALGVVSMADVKLTKVTAKQLKKLVDYYSPQVQEEEFRNASTPPSLTPTTT